MKLIEVLKPVIEQQKLMEGQANKYVYDGLQSLLNIFRKHVPDNEYPHKEVENFKPIFEEEYSEIANLPNTWKMFFARSFVALAIDYILSEVLSDDDYLNIPSNIVSRLEKKKLPAEAATIDSLELANVLAHYYGLNYPPIRNLNLLEELLESNNIEHVVDLLRQLEDEYTEQQSKHERYIPINGNEYWILEVDGYKWLDMEHYCSKADADAMRHCGNSYGIEGERSYTLNSIVKKDDSKEYRIPHIFLVLHSNGLVGEVKGHGNSKPKKEYHKAIIEFLKTDLVNGFYKGKRHAPENDFSINDLDNNLKKELVDEKGVDFFIDSMIAQLERAPRKFSEENERELMELIEKSSGSGRVSAVITMIKNIDHLSYGFNTEELKRFFGWVEPILSDFSLSYRLVRDLLPTEINSTSDHFIVMLYIDLIGNTKKQSRDDLVLQFAEYCVDNNMVEYLKHLTPIVQQLIEDEDNERSRAREITRFAMKYHLLPSEWVKSKLTEMDDEHAYPAAKALALLAVRDSGDDDFSGIKITGMTPQYFMREYRNWYKENYT